MGVVVVWGWGGGEPLQCLGVPGVVPGGDRLAPGHDEVHQQEGERNCDDERADRRDDVVALPPEVGGIAGHTPGHAEQADHVLGHESHPEADEHQPEVPLAQALPEHAAEHLGIPVVDAGEPGEHRRPEEHLVEVGHHEVGVVGGEVNRWRRQHDSRDATHEECEEEADAEQHGCRERELAVPHGADPVEELDAGRHGDEQAEEREEGQQDGAGGEHVVRPHAGGQRRDGHGGEDHALVAEDRLAGEDGEDLRHDAEERQGQDVDLGMAKEPEKVLPQQR